MKLLICTQAVDKNHPILGFFHGWIMEFSKHFDEVHVICLLKGEYNLPPHVHVYSLGKEEGESRLKYILRFYRFFGHIFFKIKVDFVFYHMGAVYNIIGAPFFFLRKLYGTKFYWWKAHGHINAFGRFALLFVDCVFTSTQSGFPIRTSKRRVVGQAIDTNRFTLPSHEQRQNIIFVGRIMPVKHLDDFIETAALLARQHTNLSFEIYGPVGDQSYFDTLQSRVRELGLSNRLVFNGSRNQEALIAIYQKSSFFLNTSLTQSMDKTVLEAALCGCIPVTGNQAFQDLLEPENLFIGEHTPQVYAQKLNELLRADLVDLRVNLSHKVSSLHSLDTFVRRIFNI